MAACSAVAHKLSVANKRIQYIKYMQKVQMPIQYIKYMQKVQMHEIEGGIGKTSATTSEDMLLPSSSFLHETIWFI
jgi:hypothetical protein